MAGSRVMLFVDSSAHGRGRPRQRRPVAVGVGRGPAAVVVCDPTGGLRLRRSAPVVLALDPDLVRRPHAAGHAVAQLVLGAPGDAVVRGRARPGAGGRRPGRPGCPGNGPDPGGGGAGAAPHRPRSPDGGSTAWWRSSPTSVTRAAPTTTGWSYGSRPWVMPANSRPAETVYVGPRRRLEQRLRDRAGQGLHPGERGHAPGGGRVHRGRPWIQDEVEPGHTWGQARPPAT